MLVSRTLAASALPISFSASAKLMFSSCPAAALVAGVKIGSDSFSAWRRPFGSSMPQILPVFW